MERPKMKESLKGYSLEEAHKIYTDCPELYRHIVKLDEYIDYLEDKLNNLVIVDVVVPKGTLRHKANALTKEEVEAKRSNA